MAVPPGLNPCDVPANVLKDYVLATKQVDFQRPCREGTARATFAEKELAAAIDAQSMEGSNNWSLRHR